jgi:hypothetical protein
MVDSCMNKVEEIYINVGGRMFTTYRSTFDAVKSPFLATLVQCELPITGFYFIDRDPEYFAIILNYLRTGVIELPYNLLQSRLDIELKYYTITQPDVPLAVHGQNWSSPKGNGEVVTVYDRIENGITGFRVSRMYGDFHPHGSLAFILTKLFDSGFTLKAHSWKSYLILF